MKKYRLKEEARKFFKEKHHTAIYPFDTWDSLQVCEDALEEVEEMYLSYGIKKDDITTYYSGWNQKEGHFQFTIHIPAMTNSKYEIIHNPIIIRDLMNNIQNTINFFVDKYKLR